MECVKLRTMTKQQTCLTIYSAIFWRAEMVQGIEFPMWVTLGNNLAEKLSNPSVFETKD